MTRTSPARRALAIAGVVALMGLVLSGCTKKTLLVDPSYNVPEGQFSPDARLVLYANSPVHYRFYTDVDLNGQFSINDTLAGERDDYFDSPVDISGLIFDGTQASAYQVFRREPNGSVRSTADYVLTPARRWLDTHWEVYRFSDGTRSGYTPPTYIGRGVLAGAVTRWSPLTNFAQAASISPATMYFRFNDQVDICALQKFPRDSVYQPGDSLFAVRWTEVAGAAGYWIQIYQPVGNLLERIRAARPSQLFLDASRDFVVAYVPAPADSFRVGQAGTTLMTRKTLLSGAEYQIRVAAVNVEGELVGFLYGDTTTVTAPDGSLARFAMGAVRVRALRPGQPPPPCL